MSRHSRTSFIISSLLTCLPLCIQAHMQMSWPYPLRSPLDPDVPYYDKDYSMTSPLLADGSDFSCKHYQYTTGTNAYDNADVIKATYYAGNTYNMTIAGAAPHHGGSCQLSLSYDNGVTFKVIKSMIGGCPITLTYDFTIPSYAPASDSAIFSWSWFNLAGNREMYQNCARVRIVSNPSQKYRRSLWNRQTSISELPDMFVCNVDNGCTTIEGSEVVFPDPGNDVVYGQDLVAANPGPGYTITGTSSSTSAAETGSSTSSSAIETGSSTSSSAIESPVSATASTTAASYVTVTGSPSTFSTEVTGLTTTAAGSTTLTSATAMTTTTTTTTGSLPTGTDLPATNGTLIIVTGDPITLSTSTSTSTSDTATSTSTPTSTSTTTDSRSSSTISPTSTRTSITSVTSSTILPPLSSSVSVSSSSTSTTLSSSYITSPSSSSSSSSSSPTPTPTPTTPPSSPSSSSSSPTSSHSITTTLPVTTLTTAPTSTPTTISPSITTSTSTSTSTSSSASGTATAQPTSCTPGTFECNSLSTFSQCVSTSSDTTTYIYMGSVAAGTQCVDGTIERQNAGPCTPSGSIFCNGTNAFYMCDQGGLVDMGPVAPGTACRDGVIGFA